MSNDLAQTFALELDDQTSGPAGTAASALEQLEARILGGQKRLREMQAAMGRLKGSTAGSTGALKSLREQMTAQKATLANAQAQYINLGGAFGKTTEKQEGFLDLAKKAGGPLGSMAGRIGNLKELIGSSVGKMVLAAAGGLALVGALVAVGVAAIAAAGAIAVATMALVRFGVASADARRAEELRLAGLIATSRRGSRLAAANADEVTAAIDRVSGVAALGRSDVSRYAESLARMGLRGVNLSAALEGAAISAAVGGDSAGRRFVALAAGAARTGRSVAGLVNDVRRRLGPLNASLNVTLGRLRERFGANLEALFGGPRIRASLDRFLYMLGQVGELFSQNTASGRALRTMLEALFPSVLDGASSAGPAVRRFFQRTIIGAQEVTIAFLRVRNAVRDVWGQIAGGTSIVDGWRASLDVARLALRSFPAAVAVVAETVSLTWHDIGRNAANGVVSGLTAGLRARAAEVTGSVTSLASRVSRGFADALGIRSPSRVFAAFGVNVSRGLAEGVRAGAPEATSAVSELVAIPTAAPASPRVIPGAPAAQSGITITIGEVVVRTEATDARGIADDIREQLARALEQLGLERGAVLT